MESYIIHTQLYKNGKYVFAEINHLNDAPQSVRECRFQAIGWILHIYKKLISLVDDWEEIGQRGNIRIALIDLASMDEEISKQLVRTDSWRERFEIDWPTLSHQEQKHALSCHYDDEKKSIFGPGLIPTIKYCLDMPNTLPTKKFNFFHQKSRKRPSKSH